MNRPPLLPLVPACLLAATLCSSCSGRVTSPPASPSIPDSIRVAYTHDARVLAWRDMTSGGTLVTDQVEIPQARADEYYRDLVRVYLACPGKAPFGEIHNRVGIILTTILVCARESTPWLDSLIAGAARTGNARLDSLRAKYQFTVGEVWPFGTASREVALRLPREMNTPVLVPLFEQVEGVEFAEPDAMGSPGIDIVATPLAGGRLQLEYINVCEEWTFILEPGDSVTFVGRKQIPC